MDDQLENAENISPNSSSTINEFSAQKNPFFCRYVEPELLTTKIYYYVDDQHIPFSTEIPIPPSKITLADFKKYITRRNYRYYCKVMDPGLNAEVKTDIRDENAVLKPNSTNGRFELFLLSETQTHSSASTLPIQQLQHGGAIRASLMAKRASGHYFDRSPKFADYVGSTEFINYSGSTEEDSTNLRLLGESNFAGIAGSLSDGDSQYTTDFTSVSQQNPQLPRRTFPDLHQPYKNGDNDGGGSKGGGGAGGHGHHHRHHHRPKFTSLNKRYDSNNKPCWTREKRKRTRRKSFPALSSTFDDTTEASMSLEMITVTFNLEGRRPFGMSIVAKSNRSGFAGIYVHEVNPGGLVALDGRIRPGYIILEVNDFPLDDYSSEDALDLIISSVKRATETRGQIKLACAPCSESVELVRNIFHPIMGEPVRPIDPTAWVQHTNAARGLNQQQQQNFVIAPQGQLQQPPPPPRYCLLPNQPNLSVPNKSATIPKTNPQQPNKIVGQTKAYEKQQQFVVDTNCCVDGGIRMIQNPATDITTTESGASSVECSVGQFAPNAGKGEASAGRKRGKAETKKKSGGGIGTALRRLMCIRTSKKGNKNNAV